MKAKQSNILLFLLCFIKEITPRQVLPPELLNQLSITPNRKPLLVVVDSKPPPQEYDDYHDLHFTGDDGVVESDEEDPKEEAKFLLFNYLLRNGDPQNTQEDLAEENRLALVDVLRSRCQAKVECEKKCDKNGRGKKNKYCPVNCKAVFDKLNLCDGPKKEKKNKCKKEKNGCGNGGKTMPPKWRLFF